MKIILVAGARPNFMKVAPIVKAIEAHNTREDTHIDYVLVHTGYAINILDQAEAQETLRLIEEIAAVGEGES